MDISESEIERDCLLHNLQIAYLNEDNTVKTTMWPKAG